jgi:hypothetical protein
MIYFFSWEFLAVGNFCRLGIFVGIFFVARKFLAEVFGGFWDFWRLGVFGVFVGLVVLRLFWWCCLGIGFSLALLKHTEAECHYLSIQRLNVIT